MPEHDCGHLCCDDRNNRFHDHWLDPDECPACDRVRVVAVPTDHGDRIPGFEHSGPCLECDSPHRQGERCAPTSQEDDHAD